MKNPPSTNRWQGLAPSRRDSLDTMTNQLEIEGAAPGAATPAESAPGLEPSAPTATSTAALFGPVAGVSLDRDRKAFDPVKHFPEKDGNGRWKKINPRRPGRPSNAEKANAPADVPAADFGDVDRIAAASSPAGAAPGAAPGIGPRDEYEQAGAATAA